MRAAILSVVAVIALPLTATGQPARPPDHPIIKKMIGVFQQPVHPIVKSVAPGGGIGAGVGFRPKDFWNTRGFASLNGVLTVNRYWSTQTSIGLQDGQYRVEAYARVRDMKRLDLYGLGNNSIRAGRTTFRLRDSEVGGMGSVRFGPVAIGGRAASLWPHAKPSDSHDYPSFEQRFTEETLPGVSSKPHFAHYQAFFNLNYPYDLNVRGFTGGDYRAAYSLFEDEASGRYSFRRFTAEAQQRIPGIRDDQRLTLHGLLSTSETDNSEVVPFFLQETLGGAGTVREFNDEIIGTDGSKATLRGFQDLRFRGPHLLLLQAEYRFTIWGPIDGTAFIDAGKVATTRSELDFNSLKHNYGFSVSLMTGDATALRVETGFGGEEGAHIFLIVGPIWAQ